jgi:hypothetical protein
MPREQLDSDVVRCPHPKAALQLQAPQREVDNPHCLKPTMAVNQGPNTGRTALVALPNRRPFFCSITHVNHA